MTNLEYLEKLKKDNFREFVIKDAKADLESRKLLALEIIAETLIGIDDKLNSFINDGKVINIDTHEV